MNIDNLSS